MTTPTLLAIAFCCAVVVAAVYDITRKRTQTRFSGPLSGGDDAAALPIPPEGQGGPLAGVYDGPLKWPGPVLPPSDAGLCGLAAVEGRSILGRHNGILDDDLLAALKRDNSLSGLARHEAADWSGWHDCRKRATGGDDDPEQPWRAGE